jgi:NADH-quinone oxidoreductase subunit C
VSTETADSGNPAGGNPVSGNPAGGNPTSGSPTLAEPAPDAIASGDADLLALPALAGVPSTAAQGQRVLYPTRESYVEVVDALREAGFALCSDLCAVDYLQHLARQLPESVEPERFEVVVNLTSVTRAQRMRIRVQVPEGDPRLPTLFGVYTGTEAMEREAYDMYGIVFDDHPDLTRILLPDDWEGHPLRKDYSVGRVPVQFKDAPGPR